MAQRAVIWFRNDLRVRDNQLLHHPEVRRAAELVAVYCVDPRHFEVSRWGDHLRTGAHRARFLAESVAELDRSLRRLGSKLFVIVGRPEDAIPSLVTTAGVLAFQREDTSEEQKVEEAVLRRVRGDALVLRHWGQTLFNREDLGWDPQQSLPMPFGKFLHGTCDHLEPRRELPAPSLGDLPPYPDWPAGYCGDEGALRAHCFSLESDADKLAVAMCCSGEAAAVVVDDQATPAIVWRGGELEGLARLEEYCVPSGLGTYHRTRNQLQGANHSSHLSPWIANGCLSVRTVYWRVKEYERTNRIEGDQRFDHVAKFVFELEWRDYFRFYCAHFGSRVFFLGGPAQAVRTWRRDAEAEARWKEGRTGVPLVDALMRELSATGYIANRGRYVVASYLVHFLGIDWRFGADWFESRLLDHDVCSNYGEWASMANVAVDLGPRYPLGLKGRGPTGGRRPGAQGSGGDPWAKGVGLGAAVFDPWEQAAQYDRSEAYVRRWVPELRGLAPGFAQRPKNLDSPYPEPLAVEPFLHVLRGASSRASASGVAVELKSWKAEGGGDRAEDEIGGGKDGMEGAGGKCRARALPSREKRVVVGKGRWVVAGKGGSTTRCENDQAAQELAIAELAKGQCHQACFQVAATHVPTIAKPSRRWRAAKTTSEGAGGATPELWLGS
mmetsp:Transcript_23020/g.48970  ORF Transcript_23020/g.48970 Transcript_23020/m.48970 type:complete len:667 (+) Transcript_23020:33-2033(+)